MKRVLLTLAVAVLFVPSQLSAAPVAVATPVASRVAAVTPVDDLIKILTPLMKLAMEIEEAGDQDMNIEQLGKALELVGKLQTLKENHGNYQLTSADRDNLMKWAKKFVTDTTGEVMTAEDLKEAREELNEYKTLNDLLEGMDLENMF